MTGLEIKRLDATKTLSGFPNRLILTQFEFEHALYAVWYSIQRVGEAFER
jgi:hypothetical protein